MRRPLRTWALVAISPSPETITPEPPPPKLPPTTTVERRRRSATSPKPVNGISVVSARPLGHRDLHLLNFSSSQQLDGKSFANIVRAKQSVNIAGVLNLIAFNGEDEIADENSSFLRGTFGRDVEHDGGRLAAAIGTGEIGRQTHRLQTYAQIAARNVAVGEQHL